MNQSKMSNNIGHMEWHIAIDDPLPSIGDILSAESRYDGNIYKVKVMKIKRLEWSKKWLRTHLIVYLMVKVVE